MHGLAHPEMGHVRIPHDMVDRPVRRRCPFHGDCLEGLASGPAINARWLQAAEQLPDDHPAWPLEARYLALALVNFICTLSPERIVIGGGVMSKAICIRSSASRSWSSSTATPTPGILNGMDDYIVAPWLAENAGVLGALALAQLQLVTDASASQDPRGR